MSSIDISARRAADRHRRTGGRALAIVAAAFSLSFVARVSRNQWRERERRVALAPCSSHSWSAPEYLRALPAGDYLRGPSLAPLGPTLYLSGLPVPAGSTGAAADSRDPRTRSSVRMVCPSEYPPAISPSITRASSAIVNTGIELHTFTGQNCTLWAGVGASRQVAVASFERDRARGGESVERAVPRARWSSAWCRIR